MKYWKDSWKKKGTDEIVTLSCRSYGSDGCKVRFIGGDGVSTEMNESEFEKEFEPVTIDFHAIKDQLAELCYLSDSFARLGKVIMKRLDPTYFEVGKLVYISNTILLKRDDVSYYGGPDHPYVIRWIKQREDRYSSGSIYLEVGIGSARKEDKKDVDYTFPIYLARPDPEDAYWFLSRYDKPY
jgi:hypothetical protein